MTRVSPSQWPRGIAVPKPDLARRMLPAQVDDALISLALPRVIPERDRVLTLHDATEARGNRV